jgi:capsular polysaccharide export protein
MHSPLLNGWFHFAGKKVLLLQGPHGPFFQRVTRELISAGAAAVSKVNFNGGDWLFYPQNSVAYQGGLSDWPAFLAQLIADKGFDCIVVFGDCRPVHAAARAAAKASGAEFWVFEEGYIRPNFITLEQHGVNGYSHLPKGRAAYDQWQPVDLPAERSLPKSFSLAAGYAMAYFIACALLWPVFRRYQHHRSLTLLDGLRWIRSFVRKQVYRIKEVRVLADLQPSGQRPYFLVILQVALDAQVAVHSPFVSVPEFIADTVRSFAQHVAASGQDVALVIKHHPMDRGYNDYTRLINQLADQHGLAGRVRYIHDQYLPQILDSAIGVVTINSTVGLSAMDHSTPVITLGASVYHMDGLTCQGSLSDFWANPARYMPDAQLHAKFRNYVVAHTQINGSFYVALPGERGKGLPWRASLAGGRATQVASAKLPPA